MATLSRILAWKIPWTEEPGRLESMGLQRVGHDLRTKQQYLTCRYFYCYWYIIAYRSPQQMGQGKENNYIPNPFPRHDISLVRPCRDLPLVISLETRKSKVLMPVQVRCTILDAWGWCTGTTQRDGMGREEGRGFRMGNTCIPVADSF